MTSDDFLGEVGQRGWYQRRLFWLFILPVCFYIPVACLSILMQVHPPDHWCHVPGRPENTTLDQWRRLTLPRVNNSNGIITYSKCEMFEPTVDLAADSWENMTGTSNATVESSLNTTGCQFGWEFDRSEFAETAISSFLWVCDSAYQRPLLLTFATAGNLVGSIVFGALADKVGRRFTFFLVTALLPLFTILSVLVPDPTAFTALRFLAALCYPVMYQLIFTLGLEFTSVQQRTFYAMVASVSFTLGMCVIPLLAYLIRDWVHLGVVTAVPALLLLACFRAVDESPRWLASRGRLTEAAAVLRRVAAVNQHPPPSAESLLAGRPAALSGGLLALLAGRRLRLKTTALTVCWATNVIMYYGLMLSFSDMSGNVFLNFFLLSLVEVPSHLLALGVCDRFGRRPTQLFFFCASAASMFAIVPLKFVAGSETAATALLLVAKFCTSLTFVVMYLQSAELYPTCVRSLGIGFTSLVGIGAGTVTPFILQLARIHTAYPFAVFGVLGVVGTLCVSLLPETRGRPLPETLADAECN